MRHILSLSGGKDSSALAVYMRDKVPDMEHVFCDTGKELPETYEYLDKIENYLGKKIIRLNTHGIFDVLLKKHKGFLPSIQARWCTPQMKSKPFEKYVGDSPCKMYVGIRADENRIGCRTRKLNIEPVYPFRDNGLVLSDVYRILEDCGLGLPKYYKWRTRSGCYFCFFQRTIEWVGLLENHPDLFDKAEAYEKEKFTWVKDRPLQWIRDNKEQVKERYRKRMEKKKMSLESAADAESSDKCTECHI